MSRTSFFSRRPHRGGTCRLQLEALEDRFAPTNMAGALAPPASGPASALVGSPSGAESVLVAFRGHADAVITGAVPMDDGLHLTVTATGEATHLGRFTRTEMVILPGDGTIDATIVFTDIHGDQLCVTASGYFTSGSTIAGTYAITGGTGRFEGASGEASFAGVTSDGAHFAITFEGTIRLRL